MKYTAPFGQFINEKNFTTVVGDYAVKFRISWDNRSNRIIAMASSGKELDKLIDTEFSETVIGKDIEDEINVQLKKWKQFFTVSIDYTYPGAGYAFELNFDELLKTLNK